MIKSAGSAHCSGQGGMTSPRLWIFENLLHVPRDGHRDNVVLLSRKGTKDEGGNKGRGKYRWCFLKNVKIKTR